MIEIFRDPDMATVGLLQGILESSGIQIFLRNDNLYNTIGPIAECAPALCVLDDADEERARGIIRSYLEAAPALAAVDVTCPHCGETCPGSFATCWNCGGSLERKVRDP